MFFLVAEQAEQPRVVTLIDVEIVQEEAAKQKERLPGIDWPDEQWELSAITALIGQPMARKLDITDWAVAKRTDEQVAELLSPAHKIEMTLKGEDDG